MAFGMLKPSMLNYSLRSSVLSVSCLSTVANTQRANPRYIKPWTTKKATVLEHLKKASNGGLNPGLSRKSLADALNTLRTKSIKATDETVELTIKLSLPQSSKKSSKSPIDSLAGQCVLPCGLGPGRSPRTLLLTDVPVPPETSTWVGGTELFEKLIQGTLPVAQIDRVLATTTLLQAVQSNKNLSKILGQRRLMPSVKAGTVIASSAPEQIVQFAHATNSTLPFKATKDGTIQVGVGRTSMPITDLITNTKAVLSSIEALNGSELVSGRRHFQLQDIKLSSTYGPSVPVQFTPTSTFATV